jgi:hypothetical protein
VLDLDADRSLVGSVLFGSRTDHELKTKSLPPCLVELNRDHVGTHDAQRGGRNHGRTTDETDQTKETLLPLLLGIDLDVRLGARSREVRDDV